MTLGAPQGPVFTSRKQKSCRQPLAEDHTGNRTETCNVTLSFYTHGYFWTQAPGIVHTVPSFDCSGRIAGNKNKQAHSWRRLKYQQQQKKGKRYATFRLTSAVLYNLNAAKRILRRRKTQKNEKISIITGMQCAYMPF